MEFNWNLLIFLVIAIGLAITPVSADSAEVTDWMGYGTDWVSISDDSGNEYRITIQMEYIKNRCHSPIDYTLKRINLYKGSNCDPDGSYIVIYRPDTYQFDWYTVKKENGFRRVPDQLVFTADTKCYTNVSYNTLKELYNGLVKEPYLYMYGHPMGMHDLESINLDSFFREHDCEKICAIFGGCINFITIVDDLGSKVNEDNALKILSAADTIRNRIPGILGALLREMYPLITIINAVNYYNELSEVTLAMNAIEEVNQAIA